ncbi:Pyrimidine-specific ribonucleoside hydrolase RihA [Pseudovibrio axinellae]|uniref:Pyrimidine-specific ribonucleoside hydrolase RihA n=1 Tax=Pseudovibrio axinellae TaxID=989403 RepID=A0A161X9T6_9HYPH|nr:nucleoside hydrolase [Pseudovibrio axinellae]KZL09458.1 Pyrimidine-specific ribonucleoside hydrolase RihA [Pseudovibrio axinellae]SEQ64258.1 purine nucleosidase/non-specific riboncleoside hydrolase [Pseudovibrio axinellae]
MPDNYVFAIDSDGGIDDAIAIMMLIGSGKQIDFITSTFGAVNVEQATQNILDVVALCKVAIPVHQGAADPISGERIDAAYVHGQDGLGGVERPEHDLYVSEEDAHRVLRDVLRKAVMGGPKLQILTIGPLTNLAEVLREEPDLAQGIDRIWSMGGTCHGRGNVTPAAEFNFLCDPEAAKVVLSQTINTTLVPWEPCLHAAIPGTVADSMFERLGDTDPAMFAQQICALMRERGRTWYHEDLLVLSAALTAAALLDPEVIARTIVCGVLVETGGEFARGAAILDHEGKTHAPIIGIMEQADRPRMERLLEQALAALGSRHQ